MSWMRGLLVALVAGALLGGSTGCGSGGGHEQRGGVTASPVGKVLAGTDEEGRHYREVDRKDAPEVAVEVQPGARDDWQVRLTVRNFRLSPAGTPPAAVTGHGVVRLFLDGRPLIWLRTTEYRLPGELIPRGTHQLTARLHADDRTVWAVQGKPVESTADITASAAEGTANPGGTG
ncbi:hypothetical protein AB0942_19580 [Streptomyces nodosus]|uniref:hypothetical protein n=1 Tax=Streptomyces nodosus TaxID=40318 RepID=UPI003455382D